MDEVPGAWTLLDGEPFKLFDPRFSESRSGLGGVALRPGRIRASEAAAGLLIEVGDGVLGVEGIQPPGGKRMRTVDWLRGRHIPESAAFV
jgi:methionyl-tRNA formyltransferase